MYLEVYIWKVCFTSQVNSFYYQRLKETLSTDIGKDSALNSTLILVMNEQFLLNFNFSEIHNCPWMSL